MVTKAPALEPSVIVIFGITGDLSQRYLMPALYHLLKDGLLHEKTSIIGVSRREVKVSEVVNEVEICIKQADTNCDADVLNELRSRLTMQQMDLEDKTAYEQLLVRLNELEEKQGVCLNRLYYLSIPPQVYEPIIRFMGLAKLNTSCQHGTAATRLLVEKPFGYDYSSAKALITETAKVFEEEQVYRIDHYLAKETVQNILTFRFQNPIFEAVWNHDRIASIEISASEKIGIEGRAHFYEGVGAVRDFIQSHLLQLLAIVTMDQPDRLNSQLIHAAKHAALQNVKQVRADQLSSTVVRGQYESYRSEAANEDSTTETFAAIKTFIDSPRWQGVPILLWTGKALSEKKTEISVSFKNDEGEALNYLRFRIQPNEGIELDLVTKKPGFEAELQTAAMEFSYRQNFGEQGHPDAYERVLVDAIKGDRTLFATSEEVLEAWRIVEPALHAWDQSSSDLQTYKAGSSGNDLIDVLRS
jgi:glucose-6-phosphate 1-dehydrogenase